MTRPQFFSSIAGRYCRVRRTPLSTLTSKKRSQSASGISANGLGSKMPRLLTSTSALGTCFMKAATPAALPRSAATPRTSAFADALANFFQSARRRALRCGRSRPPLRLLWPVRRRWRSRFRRSSRLRQRLYPSSPKSMQILLGEGSNDGGCARSILPVVATHDRLSWKTAARSAESRADRSGR